MILQLTNPQRGFDVLTQVENTAIVALMRRIGIEPGKSFDIDKAEPTVKQALESVPEDAQRNGRRPF